MMTSNKNPGAVAAASGAKVERVDLQDTTTVPDKEMAERFLVLLDEDAERFTFQTFDDNADRKDRALARVLNGTLDQLWPELCRLSDRGAGVFVTVNETDGTGRRRENVTRVRAVFQEADQADVPDLPIEPHIVVESSPGKFHRYLLTSSTALDEFDPVMARVVQEYGSDPNAKDLARVLRLPGFFHQKVDARKGLAGQRHLVRVIHESGSQPYAWDQIKAALPPIIETKTAPKPLGAGAIPDGVRDNTLASIAGTMRRRGLTADEMIPALEAVNAKRCSPPLPAHEVASIAKSIAKYDPAEARTELTDAGNAERLVARFGEDLKFVPEWGWMAWDGAKWARDELLARKRSTATAKAIHEEAAQAGATDDQKAIAGWARKSQQAQRVQAMLWLAQPSLAAKVDEFDREPWLLPVLNGVIDLRTGTLHPHRREHMNTRVAPVFYNPEATCPGWKKFLRRVLPNKEVRALMKRLAGYSLTGLTIEQVLAFLYGSGRNGKSVFLEVLATLSGDYHTAARIETLASGRGTGIPNDVAALAGARCVTVSETPEGVRLNESLVKDLTGGDTITARFLRCEYFSFQPQFKLWIRGNHKPQIRGTDDGIWRRLLLIPFTVQIPPDEVDPDLPAKLRDELPGILAWAVQGCLEWQRDGLRPPEAVTAAVSEYRAEMDLLGEFVMDRCVVAPEATAQGSLLYAAYKAWTADNGHQPVSNTRFGTALAERGFDKRKTDGVMQWQGIGIGYAFQGGREGSDTSPGSPQSRAHNVSKPEIPSRPSLPPCCPRCDGDGCEWCMAGGAAHG